MGRFNPRRLLVLDTETTELNPWAGGEPFAVPLCDEEGNTWYTEWKVDPFTRKVLPDEGDLRFLNKHFSNPRTDKVGFNTKFEMLMLNTMGLVLAGKIEDAGVAWRIIDTLRQAFKLKQICEDLGICSKEDQKTLTNEVARCRRIAKTRGWNIHEENAGDYWLPRAINPDSTHCEEYALKDVNPRTLMLWLLCEELFKDKEAPEWRRTYEFEMRKVWHALNRAEARGIGINREINAEKLKAAQEKSARVRKEIQEQLIRDGKKWTDKPNEPFNPGSSQQLARVLYHPTDGYGLECHKLTDKGNESTDWKALREHLTFPFVQKIAHQRSADKEIVNFFGAYQKLMVRDYIVEAMAPAWCIHTSINQLGAPKTSRTSSNAPNMQQVGDSKNNPNAFVPIQAREPFGPRPGYVWYCMDYSGQEMRIFADVAQIETMLEAFYSGKSVHTHNANLAWGGDQQAAWTAAGYSLELGAPSSMVTPRSPKAKESILDVWKRHGWNDFKAKTYGLGSPQAQDVGRAWLREHGFDIVKAEASIGIDRTKTRAKNLGFAKIYGAGAGGVMDMLYCSRREAIEFLGRMDEVHPGMPEFMDEFSRAAALRGYIHNLFGRRLNVDPFHSYRAVNYLVQGSAADIMKRAMCMCVDFIDMVKLDAHFIMPIHDELVFEVKKEHSYIWFLKGIQRIMQDVGQKVLSVPMPVECKRVRERWSEKEEVELV